MDINRVKEIIANQGIDTIKIGGVDIDGVYRGKRIPAKEFLDSAWEKGVSFCDVLFGWDIQNRIYEVPLKFTGWDTGYGDIVAIPDLHTFRVVPGQKNTASVICDYYTEHGEPIDIAPRNVLKKVIDKAREMGFKAFSASELEFYLFKETLETMAEKGFANPKPLLPGIHCYNLYRSTSAEFIIGEIRRRMDEYNIELEACNTEYGPGQFEVNLKYTEALEQADRTVLYKTYIKEIAAEKNLFATFMAKWQEGISGNSFHIHQSLWDLDAKQNLFYDSNNSHHISDTMRHFAGGVLATLPEFVAFYSPTINSYKRFVGESYAPYNVTWGMDNRTTAIRGITLSPTGSRLENRTPGADANPYLVTAATLAAGLYGIANKIEPPRLLIRENGYKLPKEVAKTLPTNLHDAVQLLKESKVAKEYLGENFVDHFLSTREWEIELFRKTVTNWERERYMEII